MTDQQQGLAAEYLVCSDLCKQGFTAFLAAAGSRYDVVADVGGRMIRLQVKSTRKQMKDHGHANPTYKFRLANDARKRFICSSEVDIVALVAVDCSEIAYLPAKYCGGRTMKLTPAEVAVNPWNKRGRRMNDLPFKQALEELTI